MRHLPQTDVANAASGGAGVLHRVLRARRIDAQFIAWIARPGYT